MAMIVGRCCGWSHSRFQSATQMERQLLQSDTECAECWHSFLLSLRPMNLHKKNINCLFCIRSFQCAIVCRIDTIFNWNVYIKVKMPTCDAPTLAWPRRTETSNEPTTRHCLITDNGFNFDAICQPANHCTSRRSDQLFWQQAWNVRTASTILYHMLHANVIIEQSKSREQFHLRTGANLVYRSITMSSENRGKKKLNSCKTFH